MVRRAFQASEPGGTEARSDAIWAFFDLLSVKNNNNNII